MSRARSSMSSPEHEDHGADDDSSTALHCVRRGWRRRRLGDEVFVFEEESGYLARVDGLVARRLGHAEAAAPLREALAALVDGAPVDGAERSPAPPSSDRHVVSLQLLGVRLDVRCRHQQCGEQLRSYFSASEVEAGLASPEVVVWCGWKAAGRHLYRSRPEELEGVPLDGVSVQTLRSGRQQWTSVLPPLPALASWPFKDRSSPCMPPRSAPQRRGGHPGRRPGLGQVDNGAGSGQDDGRRRGAATRPPSSIAAPPSWSRFHTPWASGRTGRRSRCR
jgi:hypothetical protein